MARRAARRMVFEEKSLSEISNAEIRRLVTRHVSERQHLDFKLSVNHKVPEEIAGFLRHVASFANSGGGYVIVGIRDDGKGRAQKFEGNLQNPESLVKSLRKNCHNYVDPRISGLEVEARTIDKHTVVLVRIPRSGRVPHMMNFQQATEFWARYEDGKGQMTRHEIQEAFLKSGPAILGGGRRRGQRAPRPRGRTPRRRADGSNLVQNGGFERGLQGWGTGALEYSRAPFLGANRFVLMGGAVARWFADKRHSRSGRCSLGVVHDSAYSAGVYSTFSQQIPVEPGVPYEASFWVRVAEKGTGGFSLRVSPNALFWDRFKVKVHDASLDWREYRVPFQWEEATTVDIRFAAEGPVKAWIDDVSVRRVQPQA